MFIYLFVLLNGSIQAECWVLPNLSLPVKPDCEFIQQMLLWEDVCALPTRGRVGSSVEHTSALCRLLPKQSHLSSDIAKGVGVLSRIERISFLLPR